MGQGLMGLEGLMGQGLMAQALMGQGLMCLEGLLRQEQRKAWGGMGSTLPLVTAQARC